MAVVALVAMVVVATSGTASAAGSHGVFTVAGANPAWTGTLTIPAAGFPAATLATNSNTPTTPTAAFLNEFTPYGALFGTTSGSNYLNAAAAAGGTPSTTTLTFATPTPAGSWAFTLGDIDADTAQVSATGPDGPLTAAQLGFQSTFNYCTAETPRPAACGGAQSDVPTWDPSTTTLTGSGTDTSGASAWFRPTVPVTTLTITYTVLTGIPSFQLWAAALNFDITGTVTLDGGGTLPGGVVLRLLDADGNEIATTSPAPDGTYTFDAVTAAAYTVEVVPPAGYETVGPSELDADATAGDVTDVDFVLAATPPPSTTTTTTTSTTTTTTTSTTLPPTSSSTTSSTSTSTTAASTTTSTTPAATSTTVAVGSGGQLPSTGSDGGATVVSLVVGATAVCAGVGLVVAARRRRSEV